MHPECPDYDLCSKCEAMPIEVHPALHPLLKMRCPDVVIPTVYRVGGTSLIAPSPATQVQTSTVATTTDPAPEKLDVAVHAEIKPETCDASVAAVTQMADGTGSIGCSLVLPSPPPFAPGTAIETVQQFSDLWRDELSKAREADTNVSREQTQNEDDLSMTSLLSAFIAKHPIRQPSTLRATFVSDVNVEDGQVFPPGAEFVKGWSIRNDGNDTWPEATCVTFVAGDRMPAFDNAPLSYHVGAVEPGSAIDVYANDMKAPDIPGKYVGYWRLSDGREPFGQSIWCE